jgi:hypothetical protein
VAKSGQPYAKVAKRNIQSSQKKRTSMRKSFCEFCEIFATFASGCPPARTCVPPLLMRLAPYESAQVKLLALFTSPVPLYFGKVGHWHIGRVRVAPVLLSREAMVPGSVPFSTQASSTARPS